MKTNLRSLAMAGACALAFLLPEAASAASGWLKAQSDNFIVYSDTDERTVRKYTEQLEYFRHFTLQLLDQSPEEEGAAPLLVYLIDDSKDLKAIRPEFDEGIAGVYFACADGVTAYSTMNRATTYTRRNQDESQMVLFHEYAHHLMYQYETRLYPNWYSEGLADYLSTTTFPDQMIVYGQVNGFRTSSLEVERAWTDFGDILEPLDKDGKFKKVDAYAFYAQSWLLTHYMLSDPARSKQLREYFHRLTIGERPVPAFEAATGVHIKDLPGILKKYLGRMPYSELKTKGLPKPNIEVRRLDKKYDGLLLPASALRTCPDDKYGKALLERLPGMNKTLAGTPEFDLAVAEAQVKYGDPAAAEAYLTKRAADAPDDFDVHHLLGRLYFRQYTEAAKAEGGATAAGPLMDKARGWFGKAYKISPDDAPNLYYFAQSMANRPGFPTPNALNAADAAVVGAPMVFDYARYNAYLNLLKGDRVTAVGILTPFSADPHSRKRSQKVRSAITAIQQGKSVDEVLSILDAEDKDDEKEKEKGKKDDKTSKS